MKRIYLLIFFFLTFSMSYAKTFIAICDGTKNKPCIVRDTYQSSNSLKNFRSADMLAQSYAGDVTGLFDLWLSGGAAFSQQDWEKAFAFIQNKIKNNKIVEQPQIIDLDLRQESHGYLNGNAINLTGPHNWMNLNKNISQVISLEKNWLLFLKQYSQINNVLTPTQFKAKQFSKGIPITIKSIQSEKSIVNKIGFEYVRFAVTDHMRPDDVDVDRFVQLVRNFKTNTWLHIHCRGGDGRTTTFMAMFDMLHNAKKVSFKEIIQRQAAVKPYYDLSVVNRKNPELTLYYKQRLEFLFQFYNFSIDYLNGYKNSWSVWKKENPFS